jgi:hypothetical protein
MLFSGGDLYHLAPADDLLRGPAQIPPPPTIRNIHFSPEACRRRERLHDLWLRLGDRMGCDPHHRDVVSLALRRVEDDVSGLNAEAVIRIWRCIRGGRQEDKDLEVRAEAV